VTTTYYYDALNRITGKSYSDATPSLYFYYDVPPAWMSDSTNVVGRLANMNNSHGGATDGLATAASFSYDAMGRIIRNFQQTPSTINACSLAAWKYTPPPPPSRNALTLLLLATCWILVTVSILVPRITATSPLGRPSAIRPLPALTFTTR